MGQRLVSLGKAKLMEVMIVCPSETQVHPLHNYETDSVYKRVVFVFLLNNNFSTSTLISLRRPDGARCAGIDARQRLSSAISSQTVKYERVRFHHDKIRRK